MKCVVIGLAFGFALLAPDPAQAQAEPEPPTAPDTSVAQEAEPLAPQPTVAPEPSRASRVESYEKPAPANRCEEADQALAECESGHLGAQLALGVGQDLLYGFGLRGGYRPISSLELGIVAAAWSGNGNLVVGAILGLLQLNGVVRLGATSSLFGGAQVGLIRRRIDIQRSDMMGETYSDGVMAFNSLGYGLQAGVAARVARSMSLRLELAWLHARGASRTKSTGYGVLEDHINAVDFVYANAAFCYAF